VAVVLLAASAGCSLEEVTLVEAQDAVVAEVYIQLNPGVAGANRVTAFLHRTLDSGSPSSRPVPGAHVVVTRSDGFSLELGGTTLETCVTVTPVEGTGTCYWSVPEAAGRIQPGDRLTVRIELPDGGLLQGTTTVPGAFDLLSGASTICAVAPETPLEVRWTRSAGAWAYVNETLISGLRDALAPRGITVDEDPLYLLGISVSSADTTVVFPGEFGVFDRFELDQALALELQKGLPSGTNAKVTITAGDRNYVNWIRGGNFNPSGQIRIPSLRGDGTGVFAATVSRSFRVLALPEGVSPTIPRCTP
jgi:hypothetical protein